MEIELIYIFFQRFNPSAEHTPTKEYGLSTSTYNESKFSFTVVNVKPISVYLQPYFENLKAVLDGNRRIVVFG